MGGIGRKGCGKIAQLQDLNYFINSINEFLDMSMGEFESVSEAAMKYAEEKYTRSVSSSGYNELFL